jgi:hypothetical protein
MLVDLARRSCYSGLQSETHWHRSAPESINDVATWQAGLQLEVPKRIVTAARKVVPDHGPTLVLCGIVAGG